MTHILVAAAIVALGEIGAMFLLSRWWQWQNRDIAGTFRTPFGAWTTPTPDSDPGGEGET